MADTYPDEEGYLGKGLVVRMCKANGAIELHSGVFIAATAVNNYISVVAGAADGDSVGIALKAASDGGYLPVAFYGMVKLLAGDTINEQDIIINDSNPTYMLPVPTYTAGQLAVWRSLNNTGTQCRLGMAVTGAAASGDEFVAIIGKLM
jgi:hypothetical protein